MGSYLRRSLKTRVTLFVLVIFLVSIWSVTFYASHTLHKDLERLSSDQQLSTVSFMAAEVNAEMEARIEALKTIAARISPAMMSNPASFQAMLEDQPTFYSLFNNGVAAAGVDGTVIAEFPRLPGRLGANFMERDYIIGPLKEGKITIGRPVMSKLMHAPAFVIAVPIRDAQGRITGVIAGVTDLRLPNFLDKVTKSSYGKTGGYLLVAPQYRLIVTATDKGRVMEKLPAPGVNPAVDRFVDGYEGSDILVSPVGVEVLSSAKGVPAAGWYVVVTLPTDEVFAPIHDMLIRARLGAIFFTLLFGGLTWWMLRRELSPMLATVKTLAMLSDAKQPPKPLQITRQDEIGELIGGFNKLLETLVQREGAVSESEKRSRDIIEASPVPFAIVDEHEDIIYRNNAFVRAVGYTTEDVPTLTQWWLRAYPDPQDRQRAAENWRKNLEDAKHANRPIAPREVEVRCKNGSVRTFMISAVALGDGISRNYLVALYDISERKQAEIALKRSEQSLRLSEGQMSISQQISGTGTWVYNFETKTVWGSAGSLRIFGFPADTKNLTLERIEECIPERERVHQAFVDLVTEGREYDLEYEITPEDGSPSKIIHSIARLERDEQQNPTVILGFIQDITERKRTDAERIQLEAQLRESQKMEALGTLAGGVAHDFNNALAMIIGNAELARQDVGPDHAALVSLQEIGKASRRAKDLVQQILAFGRRQKLERKPTTLALGVVESARLIRATLPAGVTLNVDCRGDTPAVLADATQVKQVLLNLCGNALQAVQDQGRPGVVDIRLDAYHHMHGDERSELRPGRYARLAVRDNGVGMDALTRTRIFEPFFTTKPKGKGTGLGLSVVYGIVQAHEAIIEVESAPGQGTEFRIYFPAMDDLAGVEAAHTPNPAPILGAGRHVLYVDDEEAIIFLMTRLLERQGFRVSGYTDPQEALAAARANSDQFDLAVTDYNMPGMSGLALASALREIRSDLPVVLASGFITEELRQKAPACGVRELIYKPDTVDDLCEAVARFANTHGESVRSI